MPENAATGAVIVNPISITQASPDHAPMIRLACAAHSVADAQQSAAPSPATIAIIQIQTTRLTRRKPREMVVGSKPVARSSSESRVAGFGILRLSLRSLPPGAVARDQRVRGRVVREIGVAAQL